MLTKLKSAVLTKSSPVSDLHLLEFESKVYWLKKGNGTAS